MQAAFTDSVKTEIDKQRDLVLSMQGECKIKPGAECRSIKGHAFRHGVVLQNQHPHQHHKQEFAGGRAAEAAMSSHLRLAVNGFAIEANGEQRLGYGFDCISIRAGAKSQAKRND